MAVLSGGSRIARPKSATETGPVLLAGASRDVSRPDSPPVKPIA